MGGRNCPCFESSRPGELSIANSAIILKNQIARILSANDLGETRLSVDQQDANEFLYAPTRLVPDVAKC